MSEIKLDKLSTCTNLDVVDKINEIIDKINVPDSIKIEAGELDNCLLQDTSEFHGKLTIITAKKSILIFSITNDGDTKEVKPIFIESNSIDDQTEFYNNNNKEFLYIDTEDGIRVHYSGKFIVIFDGLSGNYKEYDPTVVGSKEVSVGSKPKDWGLYVPNSVTKSGNSSWLTVESTYNKDGKSYEFRIGFDDQAVRDAINSVRTELLEIINEILSDIRDLKDKDVELSQAIDSITQNISNLSTQVSNNTTNISNLSTQVNNISTTVNNLSNEVNSIDDRLDDVEEDIDDIKQKDIDQDRDIEDIKSAIDDLNRYSPRNVSMDHSKEYTRIARFKLPTLSANAVSDFNLELKVITDNEDEINFIVTKNSAGNSVVKDIQLINLTNKSYTNVARSGNSGGELVAYELQNIQDENFVDIYLKRYNTSRDTNVSLSLINRYPTNVKFAEVEPLSKNYTQLSSPTILAADDNFKRNVDPVITTSSSVSQVTDELVPDGSGIIIRRITVPESSGPQSLHTLTVHDTSKASSESGETKTYDPASQDQSIEALSKVKVANNSGLSGSGTNADPLNLDSTDMEFDSTQFDVTYNQAQNKTIVRLKDADATSYLCEGTIELDSNPNKYVVTITKNNVTITPDDMYNTISQSITPSVKIIQDASRKVGIGTIFTLSGTPGMEGHYGYVLFTQSAWNGKLYTITGDSGSSTWDFSEASTIVDLGTLHIQSSPYFNNWELPGATPSTNLDQYLKMIKSIYKQIQTLLEANLIPTVRYTLFDDRTGVSTSGRKELNHARYVTTTCGDFFAFHANRIIPLQYLDWLFIGYYYETRQSVRYRRWSILFAYGSGQSFIEEVAPET